MKTGVLERHAETQRDLLDLQGRKRRVLELPEAPLVGVRDERHPPGPNDPVGVATARRRDRDFVVGDQQSALHERVIEPRGHQSIVVCCVAAVDLPVEDVFALEDESAGVAKRRA